MVDKQNNNHQRYQQLKINKVMLRKNQAGLNGRIVFLMKKVVF